MARDVYQALYDELTALGSRSLADALTVGVIIEETDTADLDAMLEATRESVIRRVMTNLRNGSYSHLEAFNRALDQPVSSSGSSAPAGKPQGRVQRQRGRW